MEIKEYIRKNEERFLDELASLVRIPSVSAKPEHRADIDRCAALGANSCWPQEPTRRA